MTASPPEEVGMIAELAREAGSIALDTEFMGEGRYRPLLCLVQAAVVDGSRDAMVALIDPLDGGGAEALTPLVEILADPDIEVVLHAGRQDISLLRRTLGTEVRSVFDTQLAAGFAGLPAQASYASLLSRLLGVNLAKSSSFTRWDLRPLSGEQVSYAREDVIHLPALAAELKGRLSELGRLEWAMQECLQIAAASDGRDLETAFTRLPRIATAGAATQEIAYELARWRETTAERANRTVHSVMNDATLMAIAQRAPASPDQLRQIRGAATIARRFGEEVLAAVRTASERKPSKPRHQPSAPAPTDPGDAPIVALAESLARARAQQAGLAYELVMTKAELQSLVAAQRAGRPLPPIRALDGWRRRLVGQELLRLLAGEISLSTAGGELRIAS